MRFYIDIYNQDHEITSEHYCVRCQKKVNPKTAIRIDFNEVDWYGEVNPNGSEWLGKDCYKIVLKKNENK